ncbi:MAG: hypothetical protein QOJ95_4551 [Mycobacterium sp.]|nr:hypothetical protein [Mycobacterium sp.]
MEQLSAWVGAGLVTAGVSAALLAGAGLASADSGAGSSESGGASSSDSAGSDAKGPDAKGPDAPKSRPKPTSSVDKPDTTKPAKPEGDEKDGKPENNVDQATPSDTETASPDASEPTAAPSADEADHPAKRNTSATGTPRKKPQTAGSTVSETTSTTPDDTDTTGASEKPAGIAPAAKTEQAAKRVAAPAISAKVATAPTAAPAAVVQAVAAVAAPAPAAPTLLGVIQGVVAAVVVNVGSFVFNTVQALEALVTGPPVLPPGSTVTVRSSTILLSTGQRVAANWYYPEGTDVPEHMILLQHGFLALGPMYSYTAANLATKTQSIVVTPTLSSNPFAGDANWLGGATMADSIGDLFEGNREALTQSAIDAGFTERYGVDAVLPRSFALAGHSLGANLVSGAAGHLAEDCTVDSCAAADLAGVILLDGVPLPDTLPNALAALDAKEALTGFIPVREIGAPRNLYNSTSNVNAALTAARPDRYKGVVLDGGVHSDSMQGGNPLIQFALYVAAGFPQPQNPPAVDELSVQWFNEWFAGNTESGDGLVPGTTIDVPTPNGTAHGVVIGDPSEATQLLGPVTLAPSTPSTIPEMAPTLARLAA